MVGATTGGAGMMAVLNPVPLGPRQSRHSDGQHRTGATSGRSDFRLRALLAPPEMEAAVARGAKSITLNLSGGGGPAWGDGHTAELVQLLSRGQPPVGAALQQLWQHPAPGLGHKSGAVVATTSG